MTTKPSNLHLFATARFPLHCSQIPELMACPFKAVMKFIEANPRESNSAADTGSAMHKAASAWHTNGKEVKKALAAMRAARADYPMADLLDAERLFLAYSQDPQNQTAEVVACEHHITGEINGCSFDGTLDQIRAIAESWKVWDIKTSKLPGPRIRDETTYQVCAYAALASLKFKRPVSPGGVIMVRGYDTKGVDKVFYPYDITGAQAHGMMTHVVNRIHEVRAGSVAPIPGDHCGYCIGTRACLAKLDRYTEEGKI
jgi:hypothetical protein